MSAVMVLVAGVVVSSVMGDWRVLPVILLNGILLATVILALMWTQVCQTDLMISFSQLVHIPIMLVFEFFTRRPRALALLRRVGQCLPGELEMMGEEHGPVIPGWIRQLMFVLVLVLSQPQQGMVTLLTRFLWWSIGVRILLSPLVSVVAWLVTRLSGLDSPSPGTPPIQSTGHLSWDSRSVFSLVVCLTQLGIGVSCLAHCTQCLPTWQVIGLLIVGVCSDERVQETLKTEAQEVQVDALEGYERDAMHGALLTLDLLVCGPFFVWALYHNTYPVVVLAYCNVLTVLMEYRFRISWKVDAGLSRMNRLQRASRRELEAYNDVCAVCLGPMSAARVTCCRHLFHGKCLRQALGLNTSCPLCKKPVLSGSF